MAQIYNSTEWDISLTHFHKKKTESIQQTHSINIYWIFDLYSVTVLELKHNGEPVS